MCVYSISINVAIEDSVAIVANVANAANAAIENF